MLLLLLHLLLNQLLLPEKGHGTLCSNSLGQQRFPGSWGSKQQDPGSLQTQKQQLRMLQRQLHRVQDLLPDLLQTSDILPPNVRDLFTQTHVCYSDP